jgi:carotenoid cleavage dioxygenase-like enzyme
VTDTTSTLFGSGEFFQRDNYAPVADELTEFDLPVEGATPAELDGWYLRNGSNRWDDNYGARLGVLRRDDPFGEVRWFEIDPCYVFHVANAYDSGNSIVLQAVRYPELWRHSGGFDANGVLWTWTIDLETGTVTERQLDDRAVEFPRIDDRLATLPARYAVSVGDGRLVRYDLTCGDAVEHAFGTAESPGGPGEAVFVPSTAGPAD